MTNLEIVKKLYYYLGTSENILHVTNCMSRLRVTIQRPAKIADDAKFLSLEARGIIHQDKQVHIIFNTLSHVLRTLLHNVVETTKDSLSQKLIYLAQNQIHSCQMIDDTTLRINLTKEIHPDTNFISELQKEGISLIYNNLHMTITLPQSYNTERLENMIFLWDIIVASAIMKDLSSSDIKKISYQHGQCNIQFTKAPHLKINQWEHLGITELHFVTKENELHFTTPSKSIVDNLQTIFEMVKKKS